ncbi:hypothetical protein G9A89_000519 [Geosiphon pyriformis]|nr:hypothetical protein G9A89_000519 [Geosiphon pyriformis]
MDEPRWEEDIDHTEDNMNGSSVEIDTVQENMATESTAIELGDQIVANLEAMFAAVVDTREGVTQLNDNNCVTKKVSGKKKVLGKEKVLGRKVDKEADSKKQPRNF